MCCDLIQLLCRVPFVVSNCGCVHCYLRKLSVSGNVSLLRWPDMRKVSKFVNAFYIFTWADC
jgi:hypothetical protein